MKTETVSKDSRLGVPFVLTRGVGLEVQGIGQARKGGRSEVGNRKIIYGQSTPLFDGRPDLFGELPIRLSSALDSALRAGWTRDWGMTPFCFLAGHQAGRFQVCRHGHGDALFRSESEGSCGSRECWNIVLMVWKQRGRQV